MPSSDPWRHVVKRRVHLERSQPQTRKHLGFLEKHKDYVLRAKDYHKKEKTLQRLRESAFSRNPDEFYFNMVSSRLDEKGRYQKIVKPPSASERRRENALNRNIVTAKTSADLHAVRNARERLHYVTLPKPGSHILFYEDETEREDLIALEKGDEEPTVSENATGGASSLTNATTRLGIQLLEQRRQLGNPQAVKKVTEEAVAITQSIVKEYDAISQRMKKAEKFGKALEILETQHHLSKKGHVRKVKGSDGERNIHRWEQRRLR